MTAFDLKQFCSIIQEHKITYTYLAPPVVLHLAKNQIVADYDLSSLNMITSGAAPLTKELINAEHERLGVEVKQAYGLSETSPVTHIQVCPSYPFLQMKNSKSDIEISEKMGQWPRLQWTSSPQPNRKIHV